MSATSRFFMYTRQFPYHVPFNHIWRLRTQQHGGGPSRSFRFTVQMTRRAASPQKIIVSTPAKRAPFPPRFTTIFIGYLQSQMIRQSFPFFLRPVKITMKKKIYTYICICITWCSKNETKKKKIDKIKLKSAKSNHVQRRHVESTRHSKFKTFSNVRPNVIILSPKINVRGVYKK